ncbi:MAG: DUF1223 domain-containing protein, partial [Acidobacteria bacterium]|nr:DUF1223 domain-containing protein [Acidobacteriota bacterium]
SDRTRAITAITAAATRTKAGIDLRWDDAGDSPARDMLDVHIAGGVVKANTPVWVAIAEDGLTVRVTRGENTDRALTHDGVTRHLSQAGRTDKAGAFRKLVPVRLAGSWRASATRITVFTQQAGGPVTALGMIGASDRARGSAQARR